ncbi:MAG: sigma-54 dependent transcriptional regulator [Pseudomonadota bacterium]
MARPEPGRTSPPPSVLVVDDSRDTLEVIQRHLTGAGYPVFTCTSVDDAVAFLQDHRSDLVITDLRMPRASGLDLIKYVRENLKDTEVMMITGYPSISGAVDAIRDGAAEYLVKPFTEDELMSTVGRVVERLQRRQIAEAPPEAGNRFGIIGRSPDMLQVFRRIEKAATTEANVLISGDSGTGKELVARAVHYHSDRRAAPFVPVNCAAIPDSLLESELFGHVKGAFTGARDSRAGFFEVANGGTIFLDEIGDASMGMQGKLLRVMQSKEFCMVGSSRLRTVDTRIIAATHKDLTDMIAKGLFREDLYYRLDVIDIRLPPLCERGDDILLMLQQFSETLEAKAGRPPLHFTDEALEAIRAYSWPGNIRELENLVQRLVVVSDTEKIDVIDLPPAMRFSPKRAAWAVRSLAEVEAEHILTALGATGGNKSKAAAILGIDRKTLREKLKRAQAQQRHSAVTPAGDTPAVRNTR